MTHLPESDPWRARIDFLLTHFSPEPTSGCWLWTGWIDQYGYGALRLGRAGTARLAAHRFAYRHFLGEIPEGFLVCHRCDSRACVNPAHLFLGTNADNHRDCVSNGRDNTALRVANSPRGMNNLAAKLTDGDVRAMRHRYAVGVAIRTIAKAFGVSESVAGRVVKRRKWKHVADLPGGTK